MMNCDHKPIIEGDANPCPHCPPIQTQASMDRLIAVGFGRAELLRDGVKVLDGEAAWQESETGLDLPTFADAEAMAVDDPSHDWQVVLHGPLHGETYQRQGPGVWLCIERNEGFA